MRCINPELNTNPPRVTIFQVLYESGGFIPFFQTLKYWTTFFANLEYNLESSGLQESLENQAKFHRLNSYRIINTNESIT